MNYKRFFLTASICFVASMGDFLVFKSKYSESQIFRALADNSTHAIIGCLSSLLFFSYGINTNTRTYIFNVILCTLLSSFIDIDHFILARSLHLKDLNNLGQRGFLHCTTLWIAVAGLMFMYSFMTTSFNVYLLSFTVIIAFLSHHIRDGNRRGLWICPFGHTLPINTLVYITSTALLPFLLYHAFVYFKPTINYSVVSEIV